MPVMSIRNAVWDIEKRAKVNQCPTLDLLLCGIEYLNME